MMRPLAGIYAAAVTPLNADLSPNLEAIPALLQFMAERGCHGALLLGTTGEGPSFASGERIRILQAGKRIVESRPGFKLLAGTGTPSLTESIDLTQVAFDLGYDGVVVLPPYYYRKATDEGLYLWFNELIQKAVPNDGAVLGYHFPGVAGIGFSLDLLARLKDTFPIQFVGIKDSSHDPELTSNLGEKFGDDLLVLTGTDSFLHLALQNHAGGAITAPANLISPWLREIWDAFQREEDPSGLQERVTEARRLLEKYPPFPPLLKALLARLHGFSCWPVRLPLMRLDEDLVEKALQEFKNA